MRSSINGRAILIENPLTGNTSFAQALKLKEGATRWQYAAEARDSVGKKEWQGATKYVLVRNPIDRFMSGLELCHRSSEEELNKAGASEEFTTLVKETVGKEGLLPVARTSAVLTFLRKNGLSQAPTWMQPQKRWVCMRFDYVIATHSIRKSCSLDSQQGRGEADHGGLRHVRLKEERGGA